MQEKKLKCEWIRKPEQAPASEGPAHGRNKGGRGWKA